MTMSKKEPLTLGQALRKMEPAVEALHAYLQENGVVHSCWNCEHMNRDTNICQQYKAQPPIRVMTFSCGAGWTDRIPF
jgi:uncharacterized protein YwlG (UPF0340 family)